MALAPHAYLSLQTASSRISRSNALAGIFKKDSPIPTVPESPHDDQCNAPLEIFHSKHLYTAFLQRRGNEALGSSTLGCPTATWHGGWQRHSDGVGKADVRLG